MPKNRFPLEVRVRSAHARSTWLTSFGDVAEPTHQLFCFPHAGGGTSIFHTWQRRTTTLRVAGVMLPGRERRLGEPAIADLDVLVDALVAALARFTHQPYALYGHSTGALVAFELARRIRSHNLPLPAALFVAGCDAPHLLDFERAYDLPRDELVSWLCGTEGLPAEALEYPKLIDLLLPTIRADLALAETYRYREEPPLAVPIHVFQGSRDAQTSDDGTGGWAAQTSAGCRVTVFDGGHFFVQEYEAELVALIGADLRQLAEGADR
jgi:medium-chain acyl-[acyl-carrier-protein] hydrolase